MTTALYAGSFDPLHFGHIDAIRRFSALFDTLIVCVARNVSKSPAFSLEERISMIEHEFSDLDGVVPEVFDGLLVDFAQARGASVLARGVRNLKDLEYEAQMANMNRAMAPGVETVFLLTDPRYGHLSSSLIKEVVRFGGPIGHAVPEHIRERLEGAFKARSNQ